MKKGAVKAAAAGRLGLLRDGRDGITRSDHRFFRGDDDDPPGHGQA